MYQSDVLDNVSTTTSEVTSLVKQGTDLESVSTSQTQVPTRAVVQQTDMMRHIVSVQCEDQREMSLGTGVIQVRGPGQTVHWEVYTNAHVVFPGLEPGGSCTVYIPVAPDYFPAIAVPVRISHMSDSYPEIDFAILSPIDSQLSFSDFPYAACSAIDNTIGDSVRVFGYPSSGGSTLTVTEGIVSGQQFSTYGPIFKVSAKIDTGNSGGVAINTDKQCSIGIPTWALAGEVEGLGYVQSWDMIYSAGDL